MSTIVVGFDRSKPACAALRAALREAGLRGASVRVVHAWQVTPYAAAWAAPVPPELVEQLAAHRSETLDGLQREVHALQESEDALDVDVEIETVEGPAAHVLVDAAHDADLLVVGSRGRGGVSGLLLGSVSQACAHLTPCPILIVPPHGGRKETRHFGYELAGTSP